MRLIGARVQGLWRGGLQLVLMHQRHSPSHLPDRLQIAEHDAYAGRSRGGIWFEQGQRTR